MPLRVSERTRSSRARSTISRFVLRRVSLRALWTKASSSSMLVRLIKVVYTKYRKLGVWSASTNRFARLLWVGEREGGLGGGLAQHAAEGVLGFLEALVGFGVALLGVFEVIAEFLEDVGESFHLLFHAVETAENAAGVFFDLHAAHTHGDDAKVGVERVGGDGDDFFVAAVGIDGLALGVERVEHFTINIFGRDEHQGDVERAFVGDDVFFGDGIGVALDGGGEGAARFVAVGFDAAEGVQGKLGVDGHEFFVAQENDGVGGFPGGEAVLQRELRGRKRIFEEALQSNLAEEAAGLGAAENVLDGLRGEGEAAALFVNGADLFLKLEDLLTRVL